MAKQRGDTPAKESEEQKLWEIRHWCADELLNTGAKPSPEIGLLAVDQQEAALIDALRSKDRIAAHLIYADWLDECGMSSAAIAHRLATQGFEWRYVSSFLCYFRHHIYGMYLRGPSRDRQRATDEKFGAWIVPIGDVNGSQIPQAEYLGRFDFRTTICKIHQVSWDLRDLRPGQKESSP